MMVRLLLIAYLCCACVGCQELQPTPGDDSGEHELSWVWSTRGDEFEAHLAQCQKELGNDELAASLMSRIDLETEPGRRVALRVLVKRLEHAEFHARYREILAQWRREDGGRPPGDRNLRQSLFRGHIAFLLNGKEGDPPIRLDLTEDERKDRAYWFCLDMAMHSQWDYFREASAQGLLRNVHHYHPERLDDLFVAFTQAGIHVHLRNGAVASWVGHEDLRKRVAPEVAAGFLSEAILAAQQDGEIAGRDFFDDFKAGLVEAWPALSDERKKRFIIRCTDDEICALFAGMIKDL